MNERRPRITVLISGNGSNLQALIDGCSVGLINGDVYRVVSNRKAAFGLERAHQAHILTHYHPFKPYADLDHGRRQYDADLANFINADRPDLVVLAGWMRILTPTFLELIAAPVINLHPALPGAYPGINAIERAWNDAQAGLITETGVMVHRVIEEVDAGAVLGTSTISIDTSSDLKALESTIHTAEHALLVRVVGDLCTQISKNQSL